MATWEAQSILSLEKKPIWKKMRSNLMAATSIDPKTLQAIAGHANYTLTMGRYVHKRDDKIKESGKKLSNIYS